MTPGPGNWDPLVPQEVARLFATYGGPWQIAGGWAIDLFLGKQTRYQADIDIQVLREDTADLHRALPGWMLYLADRVLCEWAEGDPVPGNVNNIWCRRPDCPWEMQLMLDEREGNDWLFRRNHAVRRDLSSITVQLKGIPVLAPEIQLLYKSRLPMRDKDVSDFHHALPALGTNRTAWLSEQLRLLYGDHPLIEAVERRETDSVQPARPGSSGQP
jgi:hypothetical protein